jgi:hypothetical protein
LGAITGLPFGNAASRAARGAASRTNIFAGPMAKTADHEALANAQRLEQAGASRDEIWSQTGWFQGKDGKWRFEIDDSGAKLAGVTPGTKAGLFRDKPDQSKGSFTGISHPELEGAYGAAPGIYGQYAPELSMEGAYLADPAGKAAPYIHAQGPSAKKALEASLHEQQHHVQDLEGFAGGGRAADDAYARLAGEVEARNVQSRMNMSPQERRATAPWLTQDVPDEQQIVRTGNSTLARAMAEGNNAPQMSEPSLKEQIEATIRQHMEADPDYIYGIRVTGDPLTVGSKAPNSRVWDDGEVLPDEYLSGPSVMGLSSPDDITAALAKARLGDYLAATKYGRGYYPGDHISLIRGFEKDYGVDPGEWIIPGGEVVASCIKK